MSDFVIENGVLRKYTGPGGDVVIPEGVTEIGGWAFDRYSALKSITFPKSVKSVGNEVFDWCGTVEGFSVSAGNSVFKSADGMLICGNELIACPRGKTGTAIIPEGVTAIRNKAFLHCDKLTEIILPGSLTNFKRVIFDSCKNLERLTVSTGNRVFRSADGVLIKENEALFCFKGRKGVVNLPEGVTSIAKDAFRGCSGLTQVNLPEGLTGIGDSAFEECSGLERIFLPDSLTGIGRHAFSKCTGLREIILPDKVIKVGDYAFSECSGQWEIPLMLRRKDGSVLHTVGAFQGLQGDKEMLYPVGKENIESFDRLLATGSYGTFRLTTAGRIKGAMSRLSDTDEPIAEEPRGMIIDFLGKKAKEVIALAEAERKPKYIETLLTLNAINESNAAKVRKLLSASALPEIQEFLNAEVLQVTANKPAKKAKPADDYAASLKSCFGIGAFDLPQVLKKDGTPLGLMETAKLLAIHERSEEWKEKAGICEEALKLLEELDNGVLQAWLLTLVDKFVGKVERVRLADNLAVPIFRYADEETVEKLFNYARLIKPYPQPYRSFCAAVYYSCTHAALIFAEKIDYLDYYAYLRGLDEDTVRDKWFSDVGLDEAGERHFDLGNRTVTVRLQPDFKYIVAEADGSTARTISKRGADPAKYERAVQDLKNMRQETKNIVKRRFDSLFDDFLSGRTRESAAWKDSYLHNLLLRQTAGMIVWVQGKSTFTMTADGPIDSAGQPYEINDGDIAVAHPVEMDRADLRRWQGYFASRGKKQPFEQIWEPVVNFDSVTAARYEGQRLPLFYFLRREKHGISFSPSAHYLGLPDCELDFAIDNYSGYYPSKDTMLTLGEFRITERSRKSNHIVTLLDRWTIVGRIRNDDVTVRDSLDKCTAAQIMEFINVAAENNAPNCAAMLLEYKQQHYPDLDPLAEFTLEL